MPASMYDRIGEVLMPFLAGEARRADAEKQRKTQLNDLLALELDKEERAEKRTIAREAQRQKAAGEILRQTQAFQEHMHDERLAQQEDQATQRNIVDLLRIQGSSKQPLDYREDASKLRRLYSTFGLQMDKMARPEYVGYYRKGPAGSPKRKEGITELKKDAENIIAETLIDMYPMADKESVGKAAIRLAGQFLTAKYRSNGGLEALFGIDLYKKDVDALAQAAGE